MENTDSATIAHMLIEYIEIFQRFEVSIMHGALCMYQDIILYVETELRDVYSC